VLLAPTKIKLSSEYKSEGKTSTSSTLLLYTSSPLILLLLLSYIKFPPFYTNISQIIMNRLSSSNKSSLWPYRHNSKHCWQQYLLDLIESNIKVAKPQTFNREVSKVSSFLMACKLYLRMRMREVSVEKQI